MHGLGVAATGSPPDRSLLHLGGRLGHVHTEPNQFGHHSGVPESARRVERRLAKFGVIVCVQLAARLVDRLQESCAIVLGVQVRYALSLPELLLHVCTRLQQNLHELGFHFNVGRPTW